MFYEINVVLAGKSGDMMERRLVLFLRGKLANNYSKNAVDF